MHGQRPEPCGQACIRLEGLGDEVRTRREVVVDGPAVRDVRRGSGGEHRPRGIGQQRAVLRRVAGEGRLPEREPVVRLVPHFVVVHGPEEVRGDGGREGREVVGVVRRVVLVGARDRRSPRDAVVEDAQHVTPCAVASATSVSYGVNTNVPFCASICDQSKSVRRRWMPSSASLDHSNARSFTDATSAPSAGWSERPTRSRSATAEGGRDASIPAPSLASPPASRAGVAASSVPEAVASSVGAADGDELPHAAVSDTSTRPLRCTQETVAQSCAEYCFSGCR